MRTAISSFASVFVIFGLFVTSVRAQVSEREIDEIKLDVSRLYSTSKKVSVRLRSGAKQMGYIDTVGADTFTLRNRNNRWDIRYEDVASVSRKGLSNNQKTALVIGAAAAVVVVAIVFRRKDQGGFRHPCLLC